MSVKHAMLNQQYTINPVLDFTTKLWEGIPIVIGRGKKAELFVLN
jgi:hypothetical protein